MEEWEQQLQDEQMRRLYRHREERMEVDKGTKIYEQMRRLRLDISAGTTHIITQR